MIVHRYVVVEFHWKRLGIQWNRENVLIYFLLVRSLIVMVYGPPASPVGMDTSHFPSSAAFVFAVTSVQEARTFTTAPGFAHPQMLTSEFLCNTIPLPMADGSFTFACTDRAVRQNNKKYNIFFIVLNYDSISIFIEVTAPVLIFFCLYARV